MRFEARQTYLADLLGNETVFIIPQYQRPYRWGIDECTTLWNDMLQACDSKEEYFLGAIVAYEKDRDKLDIIDGQQRLTTFILLFRALYESFVQEYDKGDYPKDFGKCIWQYENDKGFLFDQYFLRSEVIADEDRENLRNLLGEDLSFLNINKTNKKSKGRISRYIQNYQYFQDAIRKYKQGNASGFKNFCDAILKKKFFVLLVKCDTQNSAMTIFNTLNARGISLSNADMIKSYIYQNIKTTEEDRKEFSESWKNLEAKIEDSNNKVKDIDFLFNQYMYIIRAEKEEKDATLPSIYDFFTKEGNKNYGAKEKKWLEEALPFLTYLTDFWINPANYLTSEYKKYMDILSFFSNEAWKPFVSYLVWRKRECFENENFDKEMFSKEFHLLPAFIKRITAALINNKAGTTNIRDIVINMNVNIKNHENKLPKKEDIPDFNKEDTGYNLASNAKKTKYILLLYAYLFNDFKENIETEGLQIEHILPKKWQNINFNGWDKETHEQYVEQIGNKILLDITHNIKCSNDVFSSKQQTYKDSKLEEVQALSRKGKEWLKKENIEKRNKEIYDKIKRNTYKKTGKKRMAFYKIMHLAI